MLGLSNSRLDAAASNLHSQQAMLAANARQQIVSAAGLLRAVVRTSVAQRDLVQLAAGGRRILAVDAGLAQRLFFEADAPRDRFNRQVTQAVGADGGGHLLLNLRSELGAFHE